MDAQTLAAYAAVASVVLAAGGGLTTVAWKLYERRQLRQQQTWEAAVDVSVEVAAGYVTFQPGGKAVIVTVKNPLDYAVNVVAVAVEMNDGSRRLAIEPWVHRGATLPGQVPAHGQGMTWFDSDQLVADGLDPTKPLRVQVRLGDRAEALWSPLKPILSAGETG